MAAEEQKIGTAPEKPRYGQPCNGCGLCCVSEVCKLGKIALGEAAQAPCELILLDDGRFLCQMVLVENMAGMAPVIAAALGIGRGCDSSDIENEKAPMGVIPMSALEDPAGFAPGDLVAVTPRDE